MLGSMRPRRRFATRRAQTPLSGAVRDAPSLQFTNFAALSHQPGPGELDPRNDVLTSARCAKEHKHARYDAICATTGSIFSPFALETTGGKGASTASGWDR